MLNDDNRIRRVKWLRTHDGDSFMSLVDAVPVYRPRPWLETMIRVHGWYIAELNEEEGPYMRDVFDLILREATAEGKVLSVKMRARSFERIVSNVFIDGELLAALLSRNLIVFRSADVRGRAKLKAEVARRLSRAIQPRRMAVEDDGEEDGG